MLPFIVHRPLTLLRCPRGYDKKCFFQKHLHEAAIKGLYPIDIREKKHTEKYIYIKDKAGLMALVQLGVLEIHTWGCSISAVEKPDMITFDLDPAPDVKWHKVIQAAHYIREQLAEINLKSFVKITGGKGLHVVLPIKRLYSWDEVKIFAQTFVDYMVAKKPHEYIGTMTKSKRSGKIFIDYLRNLSGATAIAPYSTRANEHATVAIPLAWDELSARIQPTLFTIKTVPQRLAELKQDPWQDFYKSVQKLPIKK
jgi:bifunctional non-homologous end joining protein LigD